MSGHSQNALKSQRQHLDAGLCFSSLTWHAGVIQTRAFFHKRGECLFMFPNTEKLWGFQAKETILQMFNLFPCYAAKNAACPWFLIKEIERLRLSILLIYLPSLLAGWAPRGLILLCSTASSRHANLYPIPSFLSLKTCAADTYQFLFQMGRQSGLAPGSIPEKKNSDKLSC